eukprot:scaffold249592_cov22-Tisochrysis_lutea.AAC.1
MPVLFFRGRTLLLLYQTELSTDSCCSRQKKKALSRADDGVTIDGASYIYTVSHQLQWFQLACASFNHTHESVSKISDGSQSV